MNGRRAEEQLGWQPIPDVPRRFQRLLAKAGSHLDRCVVEGDLSHQILVAETLDRVVADRKFAASSVAFRVAVLNRAGIAHNWCGINESSIPDLEAAARLFAAGLHLVPAGSLEQVRLDCNLAGTLRHLHDWTGDRTRLDDGIRHARRAAAHVEEGTPLAALCHSALALLLRRKFLLGDLDVLDEAIRHAERAASVPSLVELRDTLADLLSDRYEARGGLDDLSRAIEFYRQILAGGRPTAPASPTGLPARLGNLLRDRYLRTRDPSDIEEAVRLLTETVNANRPFGATLSNLGSALLTRYHANGDMADLWSAVDLQTRALAATADMEPGANMAGSHNNLANALTEAARANADPELGEQAIEHYRTALRLTPEGDVGRSSREYNLGRALQAQSKLTNDDTLVDSAVAAYRQAVHHGFSASLEWALSAARLWGDWAAERGAWPEAAEAYGYALEATQRLFRTQLLREDKETWLADSQGLPAEAAYAMFRAGRSEDAVVALEAGRGQQLAEALERDRAELDHLAGTEHAELAGRYRVAAAELDSATRKGAGPAELRGHRDALDQAINAIRGIDGYERFLLAPTISDVHRAVPPGSVIVYLAAAQSAGLALTVHPDGQIRGVELPSATAAAVGSRTRALLDARHSASTGPGRWQGTLDAVTRWAWQAITAPALTTTGGADRIIVVPSGMLAMLPVHAAWKPDHDTSSTRRYLLDDITVTYAPNARSLDITGRIAARTPAERLAVVVDPRPTSRQPIGYARAEAAWVTHWFPRTTSLEGEQADHANVAAAAVDAEVLHFITHGHANPDSPLDSALILAGDHELTLREILELRPETPGRSHEARLAVLSACDTDRPGTTLPDEVVSLPSGLIQAGFAGVVATQWAIRSEAVSLLMARFYQLWKDERCPPAAALRASQKWLRDTTNAQKIQDLSGVAARSSDHDLLSLVRNLQLRDPDSRPYLHPSDWAGLSYHGS
ncbi:CHAT domain-containing protein [Lentzea atacamensis]|uniref:CHAT domain-containing protein n=1 Tax=Lentzea atacamensis TaxID=531938 RepID=A0A316HTK6_9PSEU|nr:CHAT domain-containing tetratricopeptide repeat protein [Lentzea atacamensis]PWK83754.1 CHAT domain-containing protein [Lentzea atacamensis]